MHMHLTGQGRRSSCWKTTDQISWNPKQPVLHFGGQQESDLVTRPKNAKVISNFIRVQKTRSNYLSCLNHRHMRAYKQVLDTQRITSGLKWVFTWLSKFISEFQNIMKFKTFHQIWSYQVLTFSDRLDLEIWMQTFAASDPSIRLSTSKCDLYSRKCKDWHSLLVYTHTSLLTIVAWQVQTRRV